jgi:hypothetical protein
MNRGKNIVVKAACLGAALLAGNFLGSPIVGAAETPKHGPVYFVNATDTQVKIEGRYYINATGVNVKLSGYWILKAGEKCYLAVKGQKLDARQFAYTLSTADGRTNWLGTATVLDARGAFVLTLSAAHLAQHRKALGKGPVKPNLQARRTKEAWDQMGKVDAVTAPIAKRNTVEYWEKFNVGYRLINKDDIDKDLDRLIRTWIALSSDFHELNVKYARIRKSLVSRIKALGPCPLDDSRKAFLWGLAYGAMNRKLSDLNKDYTAANTKLRTRKTALEKREGEVGKSLAKKYPFRFSR